MNVLVSSTAPSPVYILYVSTYYYNHQLTEGKEWVMSSLLLTTFCSVEKFDVWIAEQEDGNFMFSEGLC